MAAVQALPLCTFNGDMRQMRAECGGFNGTCDELETEGECAVCLGTFTIGQEVRLLPCGHCYHRDCIDRWLQACTFPNPPSSSVAREFRSSRLLVEAGCGRL